MSPPNHELLPIAMCPVPYVFSSIIVEPITLAFSFRPIPSSPIFHTFSGFFDLFSAHFSVSSSSLASYVLFIFVMLPFSMSSFTGFSISMVLSFTRRLPSRYICPCTPFFAGAMYDSLPGRFPPVPGSR